ncbi:mucin-3/17 [Microdochium nivale]|nr:mucin-3/17 [Microdochium nivale]
MSSTGSASSTSMESGTSSASSNTLSLESETPSVSATASSPEADITSTWTASSEASSSPTTSSTFDLANYTPPYEVTMPIVYSTAAPLTLEPTSTFELTVTLTAPPAYAFDPTTIEQQPVRVSNGSSHIFFVSNRQFIVLQNSDFPSASIAAGSQGNVQLEQMNRDLYEFIEFYLKKPPSACDKYDLTTRDSSGALLFVKYNSLNGGDLGAATISSDFTRIFTVTCEGQLLMTQWDGTSFTLEVKANGRGTRDRPRPSSPEEELRFVLTKTPSSGYGRLRLQLWQVLPVQGKWLSSDSIYCAAGQFENCNTAFYVCMKKVCDQFNWGKLPSPRAACYEDAQFWALISTTSFRSDAFNRVTSDRCAGYCAGKPLSSATSRTAAAPAARRPPATTTTAASVGRGATPATCSPAATTGAPAWPMSPATATTAAAAVISARPRPSAAAAGVSAPRTSAANICLSKKVHPRNCRTCGNFCPSGYCWDGVCVDLATLATPVRTSTCFTTDAVKNIGSSQPDAAGTGQPPWYFEIDARGVSGFNNDPNDLFA